VATPVSIAAALVAFALAGVVWAAAGPAPTQAPQLPRPGDPDAELIGLLELPTVLNLDEPGASSPPPRLPHPPLPVYADASASGAPIAHIGSPRDLRTREYTYERKGAVVRERRPGWYRIVLADGRDAWLPESAAGPYHPLPELLVGHLAYLTGNWDGWVWPEPGAGLPHEHGPWRTAARREWPVEVTATQDIGGSLFVQVRVLASDPCEGDTPKVALAGWVPAYTASGKLVVWFHSRGC